MIENVFILGIDGAGRSVLDHAQPRMRAFQETAVTAAQARTVFPSISAQCWGSMFLSVSPEDHGYDNENIAVTPHSMDDIYPTVFRLIKEARPDWKIASFSSWKPINDGIIENFDDAVKVSMKDDEVADAAAEYIRSAPEHLLFFLHLDDLDHAGHQYDYFTPEYYAVMPKVDRNIGKILDAINAAGKRENSLIIMITDHGGGAVPKSHGTDQPQDMNIFVMASAENLKKGVQVETPVSILDIAPMILRYLGIPIPAHMLGNPNALSMCEL